MSPMVKRNQESREAISWSRCDYLFKGIRPSRWWFVQPRNETFHVPLQNASPCELMLGVFTLFISFPLFVFASLVFIIQLLIVASSHSREINLCSFIQYLSSPHSSHSIAYLKSTFHCFRAN